MILRLLFAGLIMSLFATEAIAFEFHGIKSGMSETEFSSALEHLGGRYSNGSVDLNEDGLTGVHYSPTILTPSFDHNGKLYQLKLIYLPISMDEIRIGPFVKAFAKKYDVEVVEKKLSGSLVLEAVFMDKALANALFQHATQEYLDKI